MRARNLLARKSSTPGPSATSSLTTYQSSQHIGRLNVAELGAVATVYDPVVHADEVRRKWFGIDITHDDGRHEHLDFWHADVEPVK